MSELALAVLVPVLATVAWYLVAMATITKFLWSRYPSWLNAWATCPACSGTWYGTALAALFGHAYGWAFFGLDGHALPTAVLVGLWCTFWCPFLARLLYRAILELQPPADDGDGS